VTRLALYEPPIIVDGEPMPADLATHLSALIADGRRGDALALWMASTARMSDQAIAEARTQPWWPAVEAIVHTTPYDATITAPYMTGRPLPGWHWSGVTMPTLVLDGEMSPPFLRTGVGTLTRVLPNATRDTFPGQGHGAPPEMVAPGAQAVLPAERVSDWHIDERPAQESTCPEVPAPGRHSVRSATVINLTYSHAASPGRSSPASTA